MCEVKYRLKMLHIESCVCPWILVKDMYLLVWILDDGLEVFFDTLIQDDDDEYSLCILLL